MIDEFGNFVPNDSSDVFTIEVEELPNNGPVAEVLATKDTKIGSIISKLAREHQLQLGGLFLWRYGKLLQPGRTVGFYGMNDGGAFYRLHFKKHPNDEPTAVRETWAATDVLRSRAPLQWKYCASCHAFHAVAMKHWVYCDNCHGFHEVTSDDEQIESCVEDD